MRPMLNDGEPDFTDRYICDTCQHEDDIPTVGIIAGQFVSCLIGGGICAYLLIIRFRQLLQSVRSNDLGQTAADIALFLLAALFTVGFSFLLAKSLKGYYHRRAYLFPDFLPGKK